MLVKTFGSAVYGINAVTITVEVSVGQGMKYFLVGLPDNAVKESQQRIETAIKHIGYKMPALIDGDENKLSQPKSSDLEVSNFVKFLDEGLANYKKNAPMNSITNHFTEAQNTRAPHSEYDDRAQETHIKVNKR